MKDRLDPLIAQRAPWMFADMRAARAARALFMSLLRYDESVSLATLYDARSAEEILQHIANRLAKDVSVSGLEHLPRHGPALIVANHPSGIADGVMLYHAIAKVRPDVFFYANADILRVLPQFRTHIAPVEWRIDQRSKAKTRETLEYTRHAIQNGRLGVIFPSGRLAKRHGLHLRERPWMPSAAMIAKKYDLPVIPVHIKARNSALFYLLDALHPTLRDITLFHELLNKDRQPFELTMGPPISPLSLPSSSTAAIAVLQRAVLRLDQNAGRKPSLARNPQAARPADI